MPILVVCSCGRSMKLSESSAGKRGKCPSCQLPFVVPTATSPALTDTPSDPRIPALTTQLAETRRSLFWNRTWSAAALACSILSLFFPRPSTSPADSSASTLGPVEATSFILRGPSGRVHASLDADFSTPSFKLFSDGQLRSEYSLSNTGIPSLAHYYTDTKTQTGSVSCFLSGGGPGEPSLALYDKAGDQRARLGLFQGEPLFSLSAPHLRTKFQLSVHEPGVCHLDFFDQRGKFHPTLDDTGKPLYLP